MISTTRIIKTIKIYAATTFSYGLFRALSYDYAGSKEYFNKKTRKYETKEMLLTDKIGRITHSAFAAITFWTIMMGEDLAMLECKARGKDVDEYDIGKFK